MTAAPHMLTWEELCADRSLQDLPYRVELNGLNQIVMSPMYFQHGNYQTEIAGLLRRLMKDGRASVESAVQTSDNVKVLDVAWFSSEFFRQHAKAYALPVAPEICVEVLSRSNHPDEISQKRALYFEAGAREVWICGLLGEMEFFAPAGPLARSELCPEFPAKIVL